MTDPAIPSPPAHSELAPLLDRVLTFTSIRSYGAGEPVLTPGTTTNAFYYLVSGSVEVGYTDPHDTRITVALIGAGSFSARSATSTASRGCAISAPRPRPASPCSTRR